MPMKVRPSRLMIVCAGVGLLLVRAGEAWASPPEPLHEVEAPTREPLLSVGEPVVECGWPMVVAVVGNDVCTGTLIHPELVVYSGSCDVGDNPVVHFGENVLSGGSDVQVEYCATGPTNGAYCRLVEPVTEIPVAPPLFGCELGSVGVDGQPAAIVSFGATEIEPAGNKHWVAVPMGRAGFLDVGHILVVMPGICLRDLGVPLFVQADDGSWRTAGIARSTSDSCGTTGTAPNRTFDLLSSMVDWIEADSGEDITACHSPYWTPGPACAGFYAQAADVGSGNWSDWCVGTPVIGESESCGDLDPTLLPSVTLDVSDERPYVDQSLGFSATAQQQPGGFAIRRVSVEFNGVIKVGEENESELSGYYDVYGVPEGTTSIVAYAEDWAGNVVESDEVQIMVKELPRFGPLHEGSPPCAIGGDQSVISLFGLLLLGLLRRRKS